MKKMTKRGGKKSRKRGPEKLEKETGLEESVSGEWAPEGRAAGSHRLSPQRGAPEAG